MGDFQAASSDSQHQSQAFAAALVRAQQVAAKIKPSIGEVSGVLPAPGALKRPAEEEFDFGGGGPSEVKRSNLPPPPNFSANMEGGGVTSEQMMVPDKMVGMIIGRGGEQITRLQADSGCKIQMAQDSAGMNERMCTLTGPPPAIAQAKSMIDGIIASEGVGMGVGGNGGGGGPPRGGMGGGGVGMMGGMGGMGGGGGGGSGGQFEMMVPGHKVGLIIGKGGETIKMLQEQTGAKIIIIQESNEHADTKPLRISGPPDSIEAAKAKVMEILNQHDDRNGGGRGGGRGGGFGGRGRGGAPSDRGGFDRGGMRGGFGGRGGRGGGGPGRGGGGGSGWPSGGEGGEKVEYVMVPASKVGLVIGKGGDTIKSINSASGAHCEIDKQAPPDAQEKNFVIRGPPDCVERAKNMVLEKIGVIQGTGYGSFPGQTFNGGGGGGGGGFGGGGRGGGPHGGGPEFYGGGHQPQPGMGGPGAPGGADYSTQWAEYYRSLGMTREAEMIEQQQGAGPGGPAPAPQPAPGPAPQAGGGPANADYSAQWAEYYRSIGKVKEAEAIELQIRAKGPGAPAPQAQPGYPGAPGAPQYGGAQQAYQGQQGGYYPPQQGGYPGYE